MRTKFLYCVALAALMLVCQTITVYAGDVVVAPDGAGGADDIIDNTVNSADLLDGTITTTDIAADTITAGNIAAGAVGTSEIADGSVGLADLSPAATAAFASSASVNALGNRVDDVEAGVAMAMAMSSTGHVPGKKFTFSLGTGFFQGEAAASGRFSFAPRDHIVVSVGASAASGEVAGTAGISFGL